MQTGFLLGASLTLALSSNFSTQPQSNILTAVIVIVLKYSIATFIVLYFILFGQIVLYELYFGLSQLRGGTN